MGVVWDDGICKCGFPVYGKFPVSGCSVDGNVEEVELAVCLLFSCENWFWVYFVEAVKDIMEVREVGVVYDQYVVYISEVSCNFVFV